MSFRTLQWLFPMAVLLHDGEEAMGLPGWASTHATQLPVHPPAALKIRAALLIVTLAAFAVTELNSRKGPQSLWAYLTFGYMVAMLLNVFIPHVPATVMFRSYTPGVLTVVVINLPLMSYLTFRALMDHWVAGWRAGAAAAGVPVA